MEQSKILTFKDAGYCNAEFSRKIRRLMAVVNLFLINPGSNDTKLQTGKIKDNFS